MSLNGRIIHSFWFKKNWTFDYQTVDGYLKCANYINSLIIGLRTFRIFIILIVSNELNHSPQITNAAIKLHIKISCCNARKKCLETICIFVYFQTYLRKIQA